MPAGESVRALAGSVTSVLAIPSTDAVLTPVAWLTFFLLFELHPCYACVLTRIATSSSRAYLLESVKIFDDVARRKQSDEVVPQHHRHFIDSVSAHLFHCRPQFCVRIDLA
jgi:hypothetical protein